MSRNKTKVSALQEKRQVFVQNEDGEYETLEMNNDGELRTTGLKVSDLSFDEEGALNVAGITSNGGGGGSSDYKGSYNKLFQEELTGLSDSSEVIDIGSLKTITGVFSMSTETHTTANLKIEASTGLVGDDYNWHVVINEAYDGVEDLEFDFTGRYYRYTLTLTASSDDIVSFFSILLREETISEISNLPITEAGKLLVDNGSVTFKSLETYTLEGSDLETLVIPFDKTITARVKITQLSNTLYNDNQVGSLSSGLDDGIGGYVYSSIILPGQSNSEFTLTVGQTLEFTMSGEALSVQFIYLGSKSIELRVDIEEIPISSNPDMSFINGALSVNVDNQQSNTIPRGDYVYTRLINSSNTYDITANFSNVSFRYVTPSNKRFVWTKVNFLIFDESFHLGDGVNISKGVQLRHGTTMITNFKFSSELQRFFKETQSGRTEDDVGRYFYEHVFDVPLVLETAEQPNILVRDNLSHISAWQWSVEGYLID